MEQALSPAEGCQGKPSELILQTVLISQLLAYLIGWKMMKMQAGILCMAIGTVENVTRPLHSSIEWPV